MWIVESFYVEVEWFGVMVILVVVGLFVGFVIFLVIVVVFFVEIVWCGVMGSFLVCFLFVIFWIVVEWLCGYVLIGFLWNFVGYVLVDYVVFC